MSTRTKQNLIRRILAHKEAIRTHDEAMIGALAQLKAALDFKDEQITLAKKTYRLAEAFEDGDATWRPARIHKHHLVEVKP